jgi:hypothetical protein
LTARGDLSADQRGDEVGVCGALPRPHQAEAFGGLFRQTARFAAGRDWSREFATHFSEQTILATELVPRNLNEGESFRRVHQDGMGTFPESKSVVSNIFVKFIKRNVGD